MKNIVTYRPTLNSTSHLKLIKKINNSGWLSAGKFTQEFENKIKKKFKAKHVIAVNSCTSGIDAVLHCSDLKKGDEVLTTLLTFISTINTIYKFGLKIKFVDINLNDFSINLDDLKKKITKKTKVILLNHYSGIPSRVDEVIKIINKKKINLIEDAATAFGAKIKDKYIGAFKGSTSVFSFQSNKIITTGEGGLITTNDDKLAKKIREFIANGFNKDTWGRMKNVLGFYDVKNFGKKYSFSDINASYGLIQIKQIKRIVSFRKNLRKIYDKKFSELIKNEYFSVIKKNKNITLSEYNYTILLNEKKLGKNIRSRLINYLLKNNINSTVHYLTADRTSFYKKKFNYSNIPNSKYISDNILSIPFHNHLKKKDIKNISETIINFFKYL